MFLSMLLAFAAASSFSVSTSHAYYIPFNRSSFPSDFLFGSGSAAYQVYMYTKLPMCVCVCAPVRVCVIFTIYEQSVSIDGLDMLV